MFSKQRIGRDIAVSKNAPNAYATNEADKYYLGTNFIPIVCTNLVADVYPYKYAYELLETFPIGSGATAYYHPNGNIYFLIFNELLYYGKQMKHSFINPNQIRFNGLDFFDNPIFDDELYI